MWPTNAPTLSSSVTPTATRGQSAFPQARLLGLVECGTHVIVAAGIAPYARSEKAMATELLPGWLSKDMLPMADRGFYSFKLWTLACDSAAALLWRVSSTLKLAAQQGLSDGACLSTVFDSEDGARRHGRTVRVIEYTLTDSATPTQDNYRLVTNLLDPDQMPGQELAALYHERLEIEGVSDEFKTHLRASRTVLRSKTPEMEQQEMWGPVAGAFRHPPTHGASGLAARTRPGSSQLLPRGARDQAKDAASCGHSPLSVSKVWREALLAEIARGRCVSIRRHHNPRGVKRKMNNFNVRHRGEALHRKHQPTPVLRI